MRGSPISSFAAVFEVPDREDSPAAEFTPWGRIAAAATLVIGAACQVVAFLAIPQFASTTERLNWIADNEARANLSKTFDVLAMPFLFGSVLVYVLLSRRRSPKLAYAGGILFGCGAVVLLPVFFVLDAPPQLGDIAHIVGLVAASWFAWAILTARAEIPSRSH
jgi:hypothetical protein